MYPASLPIRPKVSIGRHRNFHLDASQACNGTVSGTRFYRQSIGRGLGEVQEDSTAVLIRGPRQCDKTTLAQFRCAPDVGTWRGKSFDSSRWPLVEVLCNPICAYFKKSGVYSSIFKRSWTMYSKWKLRSASGPKLH